MQISGAGEPNHSAGESVSCTRYSDRCDRSLISGADSANSLRTVHVSSSRQTPTTVRGSLVEKLSRGELLSESRIDIGFISYSELPRSARISPARISAAESCQSQGYPGT